MIRVFKHYFPQAEPSPLEEWPAAKPHRTGWAQVSYTGGALIGDLRQELEYEFGCARNCTAFLDLLVMLQMLRSVIWRKGQG
jgi:lipopolysaccharide/colanic/teichoic acid biosynthesis glycosyltransferase